MDEQNTEKVKKSDISEFISTARERFDESATASLDNRRRHRDSVAFRNGEQWSDEEKSQRVGRPTITVNRVAGTAKKIINSMKQNRPRIKVRPVDSVADPLIAEIFTGLIRNIENISDADSAYDHAGACAVDGGYGYFRVLTRYCDDDTFNQEIVIERIVNPNAVYMDESAVKADYSDGEWAFIAEDMAKKKFEKLHPKAGVADWEKGEGEERSDWFSDDTVRIAEYFYKEPVEGYVFGLQDGSSVRIDNPKLSKEKTPEGVVQIVLNQDTGEQFIYTKKRTVTSHRVMWCKITGNEILEGPQEWPGKYIPIIPCLGEEKWIDGERVLKSAIEDAKEPQRLYNWAMSNNMETLALSPKQPWIATAEQIGDFKEQWDKAYTTPMPYLLYTHMPEQPPPQRLGGSTPDAGALQLGQIAGDDIKVTTGVYDASLGARSNETSGKAIGMRQREGDIATFEFPDNQVRSIRHCGKILVDMIPRVYDTERIIRLMGDDLRKSFASQQPGPNGQPMVNPSEDGSTAWAMVNKIFTSPTTGAKKTYNDLSVGKFDVVVDTGPGYSTRRQEAAEGMIMLGQTAPQFMPILIPRIAKAMDWPDSQGIGDELKAASQPPGPSPKDQIDLQKGEQALQKGQIDLQGGMIDLEGKKLDLQKTVQEIQMGRMQGEQKMQLGKMQGEKIKMDKMQGEQHLQTMYQVARMAIQDVMRGR